MKCHFYHVEQQITNNATDEWYKRLRVSSCKRTTFLVFNVAAESVSLVKIQVSWRDCAEYIYQNFHFWFLYISQGNVATYLMYGKKNNKDYIANSVLIPKVKEFQQEVSTSDNSTPTH